MASKQMRNIVTEGSTSRKWLAGRLRQQRSVESVEPDSSDSAGEEEQEVLEPRQGDGNGAAAAHSSTRRFSVSGGEDSVRLLPSL